MTTTTATTSSALTLLPTRGNLLRWALTVDAAVTGANGLAYLVLAGPLGDLFDLPAAGLRAAGASLVVFAAGVAWLATRPLPARAGVALVVGANALWVLESAVLLAAGWGSPGTAGEVWIALQAVVVAAFAALQLAGARRA